MDAGVGGKNTRDRGARVAGDRAGWRGTTLSVRRERLAHLGAVGGGAVDVVRVSLARVGRRPVGGGQGVPSRAVSGSGRYGRRARLTCPAGPPSTAGG